MEYQLSYSELNFLNVFRTFRVETLWVEVRKDPDRIVSFVYVPSGKPAEFIFTSKLSQIAPVYELIPLSEELFVFGAKNKNLQTLRSVITKDELLSIVNANFNKKFLRELLKKKVCFVGSVKDHFPKTYHPLTAKRLYSSLHTEAKRDAYLFDVDVALLEAGGKDFTFLIEYKTGREILYRKDYLTYNERVGYSFLSKLYRTLLVVGENSFSVYDFWGRGEELIDNVKKEHLESFLESLKREKPPH